MGVEVEGAGDQYVETRIYRLASGSDNILPAHGTVLRAYQDGGPPLGTVFAFDEGTAGADETAWPRRQGLEGDTIVLILLLDTFGLEIVDHDGGKVLARKVGMRGGAITFSGVEQVNQLVLASRQHTMGRQALYRERTSHPDTSIIRIGSVVQIFDFGARGDAGVNLLLPAGTCVPP